MNWFPLGARFVNSYRLLEQVTMREVEKGTSGCVAYGFTLFAGVEHAGCAVVEALWPPPNPSGAAPAAR